MCPTVIVKRIVALFVCFILMFNVMSYESIAASGDEVRAAKKIISVVYDDSSSMFGDNWVYTNYAMQALISQLNEQDELYITFMSQPGKSYMLDISDIESQMTMIRDWSNHGATPGESIDTAKARLDGIKENDSSTQFWLAILTDGQISMNSSLKDKLNGLKGDKMSNGSPLNVVYLGMGTAASSVTGDENGGLYTYQSTSSSDIFDAMGEISNLISGRVEATNVKKIDSTTYSFSSALPLYSISVLSQQSNAYVVEAKAAEDLLNIGRNIKLDASDPFSYYTSTQLYGNVAVINNTDSSGRSQVIPASEYIIKFSSEVDAADIIIQYEPAIAIKQIITKSGMQISDVSQLAIGDRIDVTVVPVIPGTDTEIPLSDLPKDIRWRVEYEVKDEIKDSVDNTTLNGVIIRAGSGVIRCSMQIPGYAPTIFETYLSLPEIIYNLGIVVEQPEPLIYSRNSIDDGSDQGESIRFWITHEGKVLDADEIEAFDLTLEISSIECSKTGKIGFLEPGCEIISNDDGSFSLVPKGKMNILPFLMKSGEYTITVYPDKDKSVTATAQFDLTSTYKDWINLVVLLIILFLLFIIIRIILKDKFCGQTVLYEKYRLTDYGEGSLMRNSTESIELKRTSGHLLMFWKSHCFIKFQGLKIVATPGGGLMIEGKSIADCANYYISSGSDPEDSLGFISSDMIGIRDEEGKIIRQAADMPLRGTTAVYFKNRKDDQYIWRIVLD